VASSTRFHKPSFSRTLMEMCKLQHPFIVSGHLHKTFTGRQVIRGPKK
jgi:hypothetical protein